MPTQEWIYRRYLLLNGVGHGEGQDRLWAEEKARRETAARPRG